jgi:hypothetical protein
MSFREEIVELGRRLRRVRDAFEKSPGSAFCRMLDRVARKRGWESAGLATLRPNIKARCQSYIERLRPRRRLKFRRIFGPKMPRSERDC